MINLRRLIDSLGVASFCALYFYLLLFGANLFPGIHYDESWGLLVTDGILNNLSNLNFRGVVPHSASWTYPMPAIMFSLFGKSVLAYRASYVLYTSIGLFVLSGVLSRWINLRARYFLLALLMSPVVFLNSRFAIESTNFFVLAFSLVLLFISLPNRKFLWWSIGLSTLLFIGSTSHALFLSVPLTLLALRLHDKSKLLAHEKQVLLFTTLALLFFFIPLLWEGKWFLKSLALVLFLTSVLIVTLWSRMWLVLSDIFSNRYIQRGIIALSLIFLFNLLVFWDGSWLTLFYLGRLKVSWLAGWGTASFVIVLCMARIWQDVIIRKYVVAFCYLILFQGLLTVAQAPKSFQVPFLVMTMALAWALQRLSPPQFSFAVLLLVLGNWVPMYLNFWQPGLKGEAVDGSYSFLSLKDSSMDNISHRPLVEFLHSKGCRLNDAAIEYVDERRRFIYHNLALIDWKDLADGDQCQLRAKLIKPYMLQSGDQVLWQDRNQILIEIP